MRIRIKREVNWDENGNAIYATGMVGMELLIRKYIMLSLPERKPRNWPLGKQYLREILLVKTTNFLSPDQTRRGNIEVSSILVSNFFEFHLVSPLSALQKAHIPINRLQLSH